MSVRHWFAPAGFAIGGYALGVFAGVAFGHDPASTQADVCTDALDAAEVAVVAAWNLADGREAGLSDDALDLLTGRALEADNDWQDAWSACLGEGQ